MYLWVRAYCNDEYVEGANSLCTEFNVEYVDKLIKLIGIARKLARGDSGFSQLRYYDGGSWLLKGIPDEVVASLEKDPIEDEESSDLRVETEMLIVYPSAVHFLSYIKNTNAEQYTESIPRNDLLEIQKVLHARPKTLPLLLGRLKTALGQQALKLKLKE